MGFIITFQEFLFQGLGGSAYLRIFSRLQKTGGGGGYGLLLLLGGEVNSSAAPTNGGMFGG